MGDFLLVDGAGPSGADAKTKAKAVPSASRIGIPDISMG
jgi:hypothetical protein